MSGRSPASASYALAVVLVILGVVTLVAGTTIALPIVFFAVAVAILLAASSSRRKPAGV